jgi:hypothetical protein
VHDHAGRLVDDDQVLVLEHDPQRYVFRRGARRRSRRRSFVLDQVVGGDPVGSPGDPAVDAYGPLADQSRGGGTAQLGRVLGEEAVEPRRRRRGDQLVGRRKA